MPAGLVRKRQPTGPTGCITVTTAAADSGGGLFMTTSALWRVTEDRRREDTGCRADGMTSGAGCARSGGLVIVVRHKMRGTGGNIYRTVYMFRRIGKTGSRCIDVRMTVNTLSRPG